MSVRTLRPTGLHRAFQALSAAGGSVRFHTGPSTGILAFMRALPGRQERGTLESVPAAVTRSSASADQRRRILRAVGEVVAKRGYGDVTVELIVKRAHVSYKTFYKHFSSKEECFLALFDSASGFAEKAVAEKLAAEDRPWAEQVVVALRTLTDLIVEEPIISRAVVVEAPTVGPTILGRYERLTKSLVPLFRDGRELNPRGGELPETIEDTLAGSVFWSAYQRLIVGEAERLPELLPDVTELVLRTYLGQEEARRIVVEQTVREATAA
jgi:AcrR family transcriptional regulator